MSNSSDQDRFPSTTRLLVPLSVIIPVLLYLHVDSPGGSSHIAAEFRDSLHGPGFGALALLILMLFKRNARFRFDYLIAFSIATAASILSELIQLATARSSSLSDLANDLFGIVSFLLFAYAIDSFRRRTVDRALGISLATIGIIGIAINVKPLLSISSALLHRELAMPVILDFEQDWQSKFYSPLGKTNLEIVQSPKYWHGNGQQSLLLSAAAGSSRFSGLSIEPKDDWSNFDNFTFLVASHDENNHKITVRLNDRQHFGRNDDHFQQTFEVKPSPSKITIPLSLVNSAPKHRTIQLNRIQLTMIVLNVVSPDAAILVDDFQLEND